MTFLIYLIYQMYKGGVFCKKLGSEVSTQNPKFTALATLLIDLASFRYGSFWTTLKYGTCSAWSAQTVATAVKR